MEWFGLHNLRKTLASQLWETSPQAATLALGHVFRGYNPKPLRQPDGNCGRSNGRHYIAVAEKAIDILTDFESNYR